jgi:hypothetical protein
VFAALVEAAEDAGQELLFVDPRAQEPESSIEMQLAATCARLLVNRADHMAWRTLVWTVPGLGPARLAAILQAGGSSYLARLRQRAQSDATTRRAVLAGDAVLDQFGGMDEVDLREVVAIAAEALGLPLDSDRLEVLGTSPVKPTEVARYLFDLAVAESGEDVVEKPDAIAVHTIFSAKGLQAPHVFVVNAANESFAGLGDAADGLRKAYVAVTRASSALHISAPRYVKYTALGNQMGVNATRVADFLVDHCHAIGVPLNAIQGS